MPQPPERCVLSLSPDVPPPLQIPGEMCAFDGERSAPGIRVQIVLCLFGANFWQPVTFPPSRVAARRQTRVSVLRK